MPATPPGWPFFAPSTEAAVAAALDLAELAPGEHLVDLGCGEGQVLVAAARRGAHVTGIESDADLAATARQALEDEGLSSQGRVVVANLFESHLLLSLPQRPDVLFTYLSPATLQRLTPALRRLSDHVAIRLVVVDFPVPDLVPDRSASQAWLYRLPGRLRRARPAEVGWPTAGTLCVMPPEVSSLTCLEPVHSGGPVELRLTGDLSAHATAVAGCDAADRGRPVAVDLRWQPRPAGTLAHGTVHLAGLDPHPLTVLFAEEEQGQWDLADEGCEALAERVRAQPTPTTARQLLDPLGCWPSPNFGSSGP